jgi:hypothetical protein
MDFPALGFVDEAKEIMPEDLDDALLDEVRETQFSKKFWATQPLSG